MDENILNGNEIEINSVDDNQTDDNTLNLAGIIKESIVDGPGIRMTIFTQGCPHHCEGCHNPETWDFNKGKKGNVEKIFQLAKKDPLLQGLTFSGGEPFCQPKPLTKLAKLCHNNDLNIFCYTGYTFEKIISSFDTHPEWEDFLNQIDYLVDGPFILKERSLMLHFRGSKNQRILDIKKSLAQGKAVEAEDI